MVRKRLEHTEGRRRTRSSDSASVVPAGRDMGARISAALGLRVYMQTPHMRHTQVQAGNSYISRTCLA